MSPQVFKGSWWPCQGKIPASVWLLCSASTPSPATWPPPVNLSKKISVKTLKKPESTQVRGCTQVYTGDTGGVLHC